MKKGCGAFMSIVEMTMCLADIGCGVLVSTLKLTIYGPYLSIFNFFKFASNNDIHS